MKTIRFILMAATVFVVASCGYTKITRSPIEELSVAVGTNEIRAYGSAESLSEQLAYNAARAYAIAALQERIQVYVRAGLDGYGQNTSVNKEYSLDQSTRNQVQAAVQGIIAGSRIVDSRTLYDPKTEMITCEVCVAYDRADILNAMKAQSDIIIANEEQFEQSMQQAWDELDAKNNTNK